jgi:hypothetical protein
MASDRRSQPEEISLFIRLSEPEINWQRSSMGRVYWIIITIDEYTGIENLLILSACSFPGDCMKLELDWSKVCLSK